MRTIDDGFGNEWVLCERTDRECGLQIVRPGKTQCWCDWEDVEGNCIHPGGVSSEGVFTCSWCGVKMSSKERWG